MKWHRTGSLAVFKFYLHGNYRKGGCSLGVQQSILIVLPLCECGTTPPTAEHQQSWQDISMSSKGIFLPTCHLPVCLLSLVACIWGKCCRRVGWGGGNGDAVLSVERLFSNLKKACWCSGMPSVICSSADRALWSEPEPITQQGGVGGGWRHKQAWSMQQMLMITVTAEEIRLDGVQCFFGFFYPNLCFFFFF